MRKMSARTSLLTRLRPSTGLALETHVQYNSEPSPMPADDGSGCNQDVHPRGCRSGMTMAKIRAEILPKHAASSLLKSFILRVREVLSRDNCSRSTLRMKLS